MIGPVLAGKDLDKFRWLAKANAARCNGARR